MKLNNKGWSLKEMILLSSVLLIFLFIAIFFIIRLYNGLTSNNSSQEIEEKTSLTYQDVEENVLNAGMDYYNEFYNNGENVKVSIDKMKKYRFITSKELKPKGESKACDGYLEVLDGEMAAFIKCSKYETRGYEE